MLAMERVRFFCVEDAFTSVSCLPNITATNVDIKIFLYNSWPLHFWGNGTFTERFFILPLRIRACEVDPAATISEVYVLLLSKHDENFRTLSSVTIHDNHDYYDDPNHHNALMSITQLVLLELILNLDTNFINKYLSTLYETWRKEEKPILWKLSKIFLRIPRSNVKIETQQYLHDVAEEVKFFGQDTCRQSRGRNIFIHCLFQRSIG